MHSHRMSFPSIHTTKSDPTVFARLPLTLTDSDAVPRKTKFPASGIKPPMMCSGGIKPPKAGSADLQESINIRSKFNMERAKLVETLRCENIDLKQQIEGLQEQVFDMRVKALTVSPIAEKVEKVQMVDQEVQATEDNLSEHIEQLREDLRELRLEKRSLQAHVSQQQDALSTLSRTSANDNATSCMDFDMAMQAAQDL